MPESKDDARAMKQVREAVRALDEVEKLLLPVVRLLPKRQVDPEKALRALKKLLAIAPRYQALAKMRGAAAEALTPAARAQVDWIGGVIDSLDSLDDRLRLAKKQAALKPADKYDLLVKAASRITVAMSAPPRGMSPLIKELKKGVDPAGATGQLIPHLPLALLLAQALDLIGDAQKARPRYP
jgi:hypothetical protein